MSDVTGPEIDRGPDPDRGVGDAVPGGGVVEERVAEVGGESTIGADPPLDPPEV